MRKRFSSRFVGFAAALPPAGLILCSSLAAAPPKTKPHLSFPDVSTHSTVDVSPSVTNAAAVSISALKSSYTHTVRPMMQKYCISCHSGDSPSGGVSFANDTSIAAMLTNRKAWERAADNVSSKSMPPAGLPMPSDAERDKLVSFIQSTLSQADCALHDPGRVTLHRLNHAEYNNTIHDLTGLDMHPADDFPSDDVGYGFDNIGDVLTLTPLHLEKYMTAASRVSREAILAPEDRKARAALHKFSDADFKGDGQNFPDTNGHALNTNGESSIDANFIVPGRYTFRVKAFEQHAGHDYSEMALRLDSRTLTTVKVIDRQEKPGVYEVPLDISRAGVHRLGIAYLNNYKDLTTKDPALFGDRNLIIQDVEVVQTNAGSEASEAALEASLPPPVSQHRLIPYSPAPGAKEADLEAATRRNIAIFARRAYRRPATPDELERLARVARLARQQGASFERGMQVAVQVALVSPNFLFRVEHDPDPNNARLKHPVNDYELATRLSYFLWSSMPDDRLLDLAAQGKLHNLKTLDAEATRMLKDPRAKSLCDNFADQWLTLRKLAVVTPDPATFPQFNEELRIAMRGETERFFQYVVSADRPVTDFLDCDYTFLNEPLAKLYGNTEVKGPEMRLVKLQSGQRGGVLTQASILTVTSNPTRTSPVKRGKWVMENLLGSPIPPPPPNVPQLADDKKEPLTGTLRQRLEQHRKSPICASCHQRMDPIGFGLENYNAIGQWRKLDGGNAIDASGTLPGGGASFKNPAELKMALKGKTPQFVRNLTEKLLTYAIGRGVESYDRCNVAAMAQGVADNHYKFSSIVMQIVNSEPFRYRRGDAGDGKLAVSIKPQRDRSAE